jgi:hypothetical protein
MAFGSIITKRPCQASWHGRLGIVEKGLFVIIGKGKRGIHYVLNNPNDAKK